MDLKVSRLCSNCGQPMEFGAGLVSLCPKCQEQGIVTPSLTERLHQEFSPARPPWTLAAAAVVWLFFTLTILIVPSFVIVIWAQSKGIPLTPEALLNNPQVTLTGVVAVFGAHLLTLVVAWTVVTRWERRFTDVIGWSWHPRFKLRHAMVTVLLLYGSTALLEHVLPSAETEFDKLLATSQAVRLAIALLAVVTAPFIEELVYRGILYPAVEAKFGRAAGIFAIGSLFALVHFEQYGGSMLILVSITILSFVLTGVRAYTGKLLPCFVIHFLYNLVGVTLILISYELAG